MSLLLLAILLLSLYFSLSSPSSLPLGIHPLDEKYYDAEVIRCKDGSKNFTRDRLNDNFCDCPDGTDEPGTSACPGSKFYCRNLGSTPKFLFSSRVNDRICDCCDGSDEYDDVAFCPNTCVMGGNVAYQTMNHGLNANNRKSGLNAEDSVQRLGGLKILIIIQAAFITLAVAFYVLRRRGKGRRRHTR